MAFIDRSYFIGELNIPNKDQVAVQEQLDYFIEKYEKEFLEQCLGYELYRDFMAGLTGSPIDTKWNELLSGAAYSNRSSRPANWKGLVYLPGSLINAIDAANTITIIVGRGEAGDPVSGQSRVLLPSSLIGKQFTIEQRAFGQLRSDEYTITTDNGQTYFQLPTGRAFSSGDTYFYKVATLALNTTTGAVKQSPIANYVYFHYMQYAYSQTTGVGEVQTKAENAAGVSPAVKMARAWNEMCHWLWEMFEFLDTKQDDYSPWKYVSSYDMTRRFRLINAYGI